jgi:DNA-binding transcriptional regulator YdaS (Cro superfamily)
MAAAELVRCVRALGGMRRVAAAVGCSPATIIRYCAGERPVPPELAAKLRSICQLRSISAEVA